MEGNKQNDQLVMVRIYTASALNLPDVQAMAAKFAQFINDHTIYDADVVTAPRVASDAN